MIDFVEQRPNQSSNRIFFFLKKITKNNKTCLMQLYVFSFLTIRLNKENNKFETNMTTLLTITPIS